MGPKAELGHSDLIIHASHLGQRAPTVSRERFLSKDIMDYLVTVTHAMDLVASH